MFGQIARIVRNIDRPAKLIGRRCEELDQKRGRLELTGDQQLAVIDNPERADGIDHQHGHHRIGQPALGLVDQIIADHGNAHRDQCEDHHGRPLRQPGQFLERVSGERLVQRVEADVGCERHNPDQQRAEIAELWPRLDHLRQPQVRPLGAVEGHQDGPQHATANHRQAGPEQAQSRCHADRAGGQRCKVRVAGEPDRPQVPDLAVTFGQGDIVD